MNISISKLIKAEIYGGMSGYVPVRNNAGTAGVDLGRLDNGTQILIPDKTKIDAEELKNTYHEGWVQIANLQNNDFFLAAGTGENWVEQSHVKIATVVPPIVVGKKYKITAVIEVEEL